MVRFLMKESAWLLGICGLAIIACRGETAEEHCRQLLQRKAYQASAVQCVREFRATGDAEFVRLSAQAMYMLGHCDEIAHWLKELEGNPKEPGIALYRGRCERQRGRHDVAMEIQERAYKQAASAGDHNEAARNAYDLYLAYTSLADFPNSLAYGEKTLEHGEKAGDRAMFTRGVHAVLVSFMEIGDIPAARLALQMLDGSVLPEERVLIPQRKAKLYQTENQFDLAIEEYRTSLDAAMTLGLSNMVHDNRYSLALMMLRKSDWEGARLHFAKLHERLTPPYAANILHLQGIIERMSGHADAARTALEAALALDPTLDDRWRIEYELGRVAEQGSRPKEATHHYRRALTIVAEMAAALKSNELRVSFFSDRRLPYEALFRLAARANDGVQALDWIEQAKSMVFLSALADSPLPAQPAGAGKEAGSGRPWLTAARMRAQNRDELIRAALTSWPIAEAQSIEHLMRALGPHHALVYFFTTTGLWLARVSRDGVALKELVSKAESMYPDFPAIDRAVRDMVQNPGDRESGTYLSNLLLPKDMLPAAGTTLYIVPDGPLMRLPYAILRHSETRYLVQDYDIAYLPSIAVLDTMGKNRPPAYSEPVVLGDPTGDLSGAREEARKVAADFGVTANLGEKATISQLRTAASARVLHLATHANANLAESWLALADGKAHAKSIIEWQLRPGLAVLASCASARQTGQRQQMWGSLSTAFLASGTPTVLASLWSVADDATRALVLRFYEHGGAEAPAKGLAQTQRDLIRRGAPPSMWAPFVVMGAASNETGSHD